MLIFAGLNVQISFTKTHLRETYTIIYANFQTQLHAMIICRNVKIDN